LPLATRAVKKIPTVQMDSETQWVH